MAGENENQNEGENKGDGEGENKGKPEGENKPGSVAPEVQAAIDEALKPIKSKLDAAYAARDAALTKAAEFERKEREREAAALQEQGKHKEAAELLVAEERAARVAAEKKVVELTRDNELRAALSKLRFQNDSAHEMAFGRLVSQLVQDDKGVWKHKSGVDISAAVKTFSEDSANTFLFVAKQSSGGGSKSPKEGTDNSGDKSLFGLSQDEVLQRAREGKLRQRR